jgi:hypothetical protein
VGPQIGPSRRDNDDDDDDHVGDPSAGTVALS